MSKLKSNSKKSAEKGDNKSSLKEVISKKEEVIESIIAENPEVKTVVTTNVEGEALIKTPDKEPSKDKK
jgi:hypothetical protein